MKIVKLYRKHFSIFGFFQYLKPNTRRRNNRPMLFLHVFYFIINYLTTKYNKLIQLYIVKPKLNLVLYSHHGDSRERSRYSSTETVSPAGPSSGRGRVPEGADSFKKIDYMWGRALPSVLPLSPTMALGGPDHLHDIVILICDI